MKQAMSEFDLISRLQEIIGLPPGQGVAGCVVGIGDDGAVLEVPSDRELVVCTDTLVNGVHFPLSTSPSAIGHKALAVNLSDLAAMAAKPAWFFLALTLPEEDTEWLDSFAESMAGLASRAGITLCGGDTTSGPLSITVTVLGLVEKGRALLRSGARPGDAVVVSGRPGSAAHALANLRRGQIPAPEDLKALEYPEPRLSLGKSLAGLASSCIDISDGLAADLGHILEQSRVGAVLHPDKLPCPSSLSMLDEEQRWPLQLAGGDDYELCFTLPPEGLKELPALARSSGIELTVIGEISDGQVLEFITRDGQAYDPGMTGYLHFGGREPGNQ